MTAQYTDRIRYKRRGYELFSEPLEDFFNDEQRKPEVFSPDRSACWRGYLALWRIKRNKLFLEQIEPCGPDAFQKSSKREKRPTSVTLTRISQDRQGRFLPSGIQANFAWYQAKSCNIFTCLTPASTQTRSC